MSNTFEIYFNDLTESKQREYLSFQGVTTPAELNEDIFPVAVVEIEEEQEGN